MPAEAKQAEPEEKQAAAAAEEEQAEEKQPELQLIKERLYGILRGVDFQVCGWCGLTGVGEAWTGASGWLGCS